MIQVGSVQVSGSEEQVAVSETGLMGLGPCEVCPAGVSSTIMGLVSGSNNDILSIDCYLGAIEVEPGRENLFGEPLGKLVLPGSAGHVQVEEHNPGSAGVGGDVSTSIELVNPNPVIHSKNLAIRGKTVELISEPSAEDASFVPAWRGEIKIEPFR